MKTRFIAFVGFVGLSASIACSGSSTTAPSLPVTPPISTTLTASAPAGVSSEVWRSAFEDDGRLYRPNAIHLVLSPEIDPATKAIWDSVVNQIVGYTGGKTPVDFISSTSGQGNFIVSISSLASCSDLASACATTILNGNGTIPGGKIEFGSAVEMTKANVVMHEIFHTLGITHSTKPGIMNVTGLGQPQPSDEEVKMVLGRYVPPLLASYAP